MEESANKHRRYHSFLTIATWAVLIGIWFFVTEFQIVDSVLLPLIFPASLPQIFVGIRTAVGVAYTTLVASEMVAATNGIGWMVLDASKYLRSDVIFVGIIIMGLSGVMLDMSLRSLQEHFVFWSPGIGKEAKAESVEKNSFQLRKALSTIFAIFLILVVLLGRFQNSHAGEQVVRIGFLRVPNDEMVAKAAGIIEQEFAKKNVSVEFIAFDSGVDANKAFSSKSIDFARYANSGYSCRLAKRRY